MPEAEQGMNVARVASFRAGLPVDAAAMTINRYCASGLQAIALAAERIRGGGAEVIVAGGVESMSMVPMGGNKIAVNPWLVENYPGSYLSMGLTAERLAKHYGISREDADQFALQSHQKAVAAIQSGHFESEIVPVPVTMATPNGNGKSRRHYRVQHRRRSSRRYHRRGAGEAAARLPRQRHRHRRQFFADFRWSRRRGRDVRRTRRRSGPARRWRGLSRMPMPDAIPRRWALGPVYAVPKALRLAGLTLDQMDVIELNEAFACQALAVIRQLNLDPAKVNVNGGAIALGHPLGCTGAKLTATILRELRRRKGRYGLVTMCVGGGMGAAGIFENLA